MAATDTDQASSVIQQFGFYLPPEEDLAIADKVAELTLEEQRKIAEQHDPDTLLYNTDFWGRPTQIKALNSDVWLTVLLAGRGFGKTWSISKWAHQKAMSMPGSRGALVGRIVSEVRDVIVEGDSGILNIVPESERPRYIPAKRKLIWPNGTEAMTFSADVSAQLRGPQFHWGVADELGSWRSKPDASGLDAWGNLRIAVRLTAKDQPPQIMVATTPRRTPAILEIMKLAAEQSERVLMVRGSTYANRHLDKTYFDTMTGLYAGTRLGDQELEGILVGNIDGALLTDKILDDHRQLTGHPNPLDLPLRVIGVDPSVSETPNDYCGIIAMGSTAERKLFQRHAWIFEDASILGSPRKWARVAADMARKYRAVVIVEDNQGGEMCRMVIQHEDAAIPVLTVKAMAGKALRAESAVLAYEQGRVHHTDYFSQLESEYTTWVPGETIKSPDRLDAAVHGLTGLLVKPPVGWAGAVRVTSSSAGRRLPDIRERRLPTSLEDFRNRFGAGSPGRRRARVPGVRPRDLWGRR